MNPSNVDDADNLAALARRHTDTALKTLIRIMRDPKATARDRRKAAAILRKVLGVVVDDRQQVSIHDPSV